ncbi:MAG: hypothetical protein WD182_03830 [Bacteroidota bacterium]
MNRKLKLLTENNKEVWILLKSKYKLFHLSNVFFRDLHFGVMSYLQVKGVRHRYADAEQLTRQWIEALEKSGLLKRIDGDAYMLNNPEFKKPAVKPAVAAKPAAPKPAAAPVTTTATAGVSSPQDAPAGQRS